MVCLVFSRVQSHPIWKSVVCKDFRTSTDRDTVKVHIKSRVVSVEGPRGLSKRAPYTAELYSLMHYRQARQRHVTSFRLLFATHQILDRYRVTPRLPQERRHTTHSQDNHQQSHYRRHKGIQVQNALRLRTFPHQCQYREELGDRTLRS